MKMMIALMLLAVASCQQFKRIKVGEYDAVSVHDQDGKPLYGILLAPGDSYQKVVMRHRMGATPNSVCPVNAKDSDINYLDADNYLKSYAQGQLGCWPDDVHFSATQQYQYGNPSCLSTTAPVWSDLTPTSGTFDASDSYFTNNLSTVVTKDFTMEGQFTQSISTSNTVTTGFSTSATFSIEEGIDAVFKATESFSISASVTTSNTNSQTDTKVISITDHQQVNVQPGQCVHASEILSTLKYNAKYTVKQQITNYYFANYSGTCQGHYYWFLSLYYVDQSKVTRNVQGVLNSKVGTTFTGSVTNC